MKGHPLPSGYQKLIKTWNSDMTPRMTCLSNRALFGLSNEFYDYFNLDYNLN